MKRHLLLSGLLAALIGACGCGSSKPEVPSWFKSGNGKTKDTKPAAKITVDSGLRDLQDKMKQLEKKIAALDEAIVSVDKRQETLVKSLRNEGVRSSEDLNKPGIKDDEAVKRYVSSLIKNRKEHDKYVQMRKEFKILYEEGVDAKDSLERLVKLEKAGISDKDLEKITITIKEIEARLDTKDPKNPVDDLKADAVLDNALKKGGF